MSPCLAVVSIGCPAGIGPEVALAAVDVDGPAVRAVIVGDLSLLRERAGAIGIDPTRLALVDRPRAAATLPDRSIAVVQIGPALAPAARQAGVPTPEGGAAQLAWIDAACDAVQRGEADVMVTGPASKESIAHAYDQREAGVDPAIVAAARVFRGHTEHLGARLGAPSTVMAFVADALTISLATTHVALSAVPRALSIDGVAEAAYWTVRLVDDLALDPALAVAVLALNPHAGEGGLLGDEERVVIGPAIVRARARLTAEGRGRALVGPIPAEAAIRQAAREKRYAACVAMYHDQATIPSKLLGFGDAVNVTLGLPIVRTSVDHGTAYDLAGTGRADPSGMRAALALAARLWTSAGR